MHHISSISTTKNSKQKLADNSIIPGKMPPHSAEIEEAVLGALLLQGQRMDEVYTLLPYAHCFYAEAHVHIYDALLRLYKDDRLIDALTVAEELTKTGKLERAGGGLKIAQLMQDVVNAAHLEAHAHIVMEKYLQRELIRAAGDIITEAYAPDADALELLDKAGEHISHIAGNTARSGYVHISTAVMEAMNAMEETAMGGKGVSGLPTGYQGLDRFIYGWQPEDLVILAARPSVGKTAFALNLALNLVTHPDRPGGVGIFSLEMGRRKLINRCIATLSGIPLDKIRRSDLGPAEWQLATQTSNRLAALPIHIDDTGGLTIYELRSKARKMVRKNGVKLLIIDYLQLMQGTDNNRNSNRENEVARISRGLKALAKELQVPIIALSQLNRMVENRKENKNEPFLADLRESGSIEQDADSVLFLYRHDYQSLLPEDYSDHKVYLKIAKNRDGRTGVLSFTSHPATQKFVE